MPVKPPSQMTPAEIRREVKQILIQGYLRLKLATASHDQLPRYAEKARNH